SDRMQSLVKAFCRIRASPVALFRRGGFRRLGLVRSGFGFRNGGLRLWRGGFRLRGGGLGLRGDGFGLWGGLGLRWGSGSFRRRRLFAGLMLRNRHLDGHGDAANKFEVYLVVAEGADGLAQIDVAAVDLAAGLLADGVSDVHGGDGAVEARAALDRA